MDNNDKFKLITRRYLAWGLAFLICGALVFVVIYSLIFTMGCRELAMAAMGGLIAIISRIIGDYFGKKTSEE